MGKGAPPAEARAFGTEQCTIAHTLDILGVAVPLNPSCGLEGTRVLKRKLEAQRRTDVLQTDFHLLEGEAQTVSGRYPAPTLIWGLNSTAYPHS
eukprot:5149607-Amphidinium_carterae.1